LRWAGGKRQILQHLLANVPNDAGDRLYIEPFLGAGSLFFALQPKRAILGDANASLTDTYCQIRDSPKAVLLELRALITAHSSEHYYAVRDQYNASRPSAKQAARFIYLNKACFNGIFRVNAKGKFNVPKGSKDVLSVPSVEELVSIGRALESAEIAPLDYAETMRKATSMSFVYLDPPYPALNETAYFSHYTVDRFDNASQEKLAFQTNKVHQKGALFLMSNADVPSIRALYKDYQIDELPVRRFVTCKKARIQVSELLIRNY
jgi:DNA adenine methylase